jgi:hypothetical protein
VIKEQRWDWTPVRRGDAYCAPSCGAGCTFAAYELAVQRAEHLSAQLGDGWTYRVWENMGWFYEAIHEAACLTVHAHHDSCRKSVQYWAEMSGENIRQICSEITVADPHVAVRQVIVTAMEVAAALNAAVLAAVQGKAPDEKPRIPGNVRLLKAPKLLRGKQ